MTRSKVNETVAVSPARFIETGREFIGELLYKCCRVQGMDMAVVVVVKGLILICVVVCILLRDGHASLGKLADIVHQPGHGYFQDCLFHKNLSVLLPISSSIIFSAGHSRRLYLENKHSSDST